MFILNDMEKCIRSKCPAFGALGLVLLMAGSTAHGASISSSAQEMKDFMNQYVKDRVMALMEDNLWKTSTLYSAH